MAPLPPLTGKLPSAAVTEEAIPALPSTPKHLPVSMTPDEPLCPTATLPGLMSTTKLPPVPLTQDEPPAPAAQVLGLSQSECLAILDEAMKLVQLSPRTVIQNSRLLHLLKLYFQTKSPTSLQFRSMICHNNLNISVTLNDFNLYVIQPQTDFEFQLGDQPPDVETQFQRIANRTKSHGKDLSEHAHAKIRFVLRNLQHPEQTSIDSYSVPKTWLNAILGLQGKSTRLLTGVPSLQELHSRIQCSVEYSLKSESPYFNVDSGEAWKRQIYDHPRESIDFDELQLLAMSKFPEYLNSFLGERDLYLDERAGVKVPYYVPEVAARFKALIGDAPPRRVEGIPLKRRSDSPKGEIGGTVVAIHQYLSPAFLAYFTTDQDSCAYMDDIRSKHKKDRKIRVSSSDHLNSKPVWVQFGEKSDPYLYLSQKASAGEELWLKIVNYLMHLLEEFVNEFVSSEVSRIRGGLPPLSSDSEKMYKAPRYATNVAACGDPLVSLFGKHTDLRFGLDSATIPLFSRDNLIVPTGCIQNHSQSITKVTWSTKEEPSVEVGSVTQEQNLIHMQLGRVQVHWYHAVSRILLFFRVSTQ